MPVSDQHQIDEAIRKVQDGDIEEYAVVVRAYEHRLRGLVASLSSRGINADEIAHAAFVEAYMKIDRFEPGTNFYAWLSVFARNLVLAALRREKRESQRRQNLVEHLVVERLARETERDAELAQQNRIGALRRCVERLSEDQRRLLAMRYQTEAPVAVLAQKLDVTVNALKVRLFGLRQKLRTCVQRRLQVEGVE